MILVSAFLAASVVGCRRRCTVVVAVVLLAVGVAVAVPLVPVGVAVGALVLPPMGVAEIVAAVALVLPLGVVLAALLPVGVAVALLGVLVHHRLRLRPNRIS